MEFIRKNVNNRTNTVISSSGGGSYSGSSGFSGTLETHTIFSQPFNGTYDVRGDLADVDNITANGSVTTDSGFIVKGKDAEGVYTDEDLNIYIEDGSSEFKGMQVYNFDNNVSAPLFVGNVSATEGTITDLISDNISTSKCIVNNADNNGTKLSIYFNKDGTQFEGGKVYNFDSSIITSSVEAENVNSEYLTTNVGTISELSSTNILVEEYLSSAYADISEALSTYEFTAFDADISKIISSTIEVDNLTVKKAAHFFKLIIDEIKSVGGQLIISPANASFDKVVISDGNYKCYFRAVEGDRKIDNQFEVNDQVVCQTFNAAEGTNFNTSNKFYWRLVIAKGTEKLSGIDYHYIILSDSDKDGDSNGVPTEGDKVALLGNRNDTSRQNAIIISAYSSAFLDSGITAPFIVQYSGINNYSLSTHRNSIISNGKNLFTGDFVLTSGEDVGGQISEIKATAKDISLFVQEPENINMFEGSNGNNYGCWKVSGVSVSTKSGTNYILVLGGSNSGGYILQPSKYYVTTNKVNVSLEVSELQGLSSYYSMEICDESGTVISNKVNLATGTKSYAFTLTKVPNSIVHLKISLVAGSRLAFRNEKALLETVPKRISGIEVDIDSITSRVSNAESNITQVTQKADGLSTKVSTLEGDVSEIEQTVGQITTRISNVEGDVSEISQQVDGIATRVSTAEGNISQIIQNANTISSRIDSVEGDISEISQKADLIESKIVTEDTINSKITQSKDSIKAEVYNEMNQATGIDITTGTITLNADKTVFNGNINIRNSDEGVVVFDDKGNASVIVQNKKIPSLSNLDNSTHDYIQTDNFSTGANNTFTSAPQKIGTAKSGDVISVTGGSLYYCYVTSDNQVKLITLNGTSYLEYYYTIKNTTTGKSSNSSVFNHKTIQDSLEGILMSGANFSITEDGDYEVILNITHCNPTMIYSTYRIVWGYYFDKKVSQYTQLGTNGLVSVQDKYKYMYFGDEGFEARMAYYNGFRVGKYRCQQVLGENDGTTVWGSLVSKVEMTVNPQTTSMNVVAGGTSQGTKNVVRADANYYDIDMFVFKSLSTEVWIKLPVSYVEYNGVGYYIGIGRVIKIRNLTTQKCYVYVSDTSTKIYDSSGTSGVSYLNIGNSSAEFAWDGTEWIRTK